MKKLMALMTLMMALTAPKAAQAFEDFFSQGAYVSAFGAASFATDKHKNHDHSGSGNSHHNKLDTGYFFSGALGTRFCEGWRAEIETGYHHNKAKKHHHGSGSHHNTNKHSSNTWSVLVNGLYDIPTCWCIKPFVGAGIGWASTSHHKNNKHHNSSGAACDTCDDSGSSSSHHHKNHRKDGFAWQLIAGVAYPICDNWEVSLQYRYFNPAQNRLHNNDVGVGLAYTF